MLRSIKSPDGHMKEEIIRAKWTMDGATTLREAAQKLRAYAGQLEKMEAGGWQLVDEVSDDYGTASVS
jgi:uncharacterized protein with GYD domain